MPCTSAILPLSLPHTANPARARALRQFSQGVEVSKARISYVLPSAVCDFHPDGRLGAPRPAPITGLLWFENFLIVSVVRRLF